MEILRTPDDRFSNLPGFAFGANYLEDLVAAPDCRLHYLDEGPADADITWLCLHGQPTWCYLYRKMIPVFVAAGHRVVAPDFIGFGRSDKPDDDSLYTFEFHRNVLLEFVERLDLKNIHLVCQDWGGILGMTLPMDRADRYAAMLVMNTALGTGDVPLGEGFLAWREYVRSRPDMDIAKLMQRSTSILNEEEANAYAAPFPDASFKAGVRKFPELVPDNPDAPGAELSRRVRTWWQNEWQGKSLMAIGVQDPVLGVPAMRYLHKQIRNCPPPIELPDAGHFVQEWGEEIASEALRQLA
ncbi:MAG: haloalkane dehalogenase [Woeseiaceae bacterium]